jgi:hypothetical protein
LSILEKWDLKIATVYTISGLTVLVLQGKSSGAFSCSIVSPFLAGCIHADTDSDPPSAPSNTRKGVLAPLLLRVFAVEGTVCPLRQAAFTSQYPYCESETDEHLPSSFSDLYQHSIFSETVRHTYEPLERLTRPFVGLAHCTSWAPQSTVSGGPRARESSYIK